VTPASWLTSGWIDVALTAAWSLLVFAVATWVWRRPSGD
jgi:hypothetical protein